MESSELAPLVCQQSSRGGRGYFSTAAVAAAEELLRVRPIAMVLHDHHLASRCAGCAASAADVANAGEPSPTLTACDTCGQLRLCNACAPRCAATHRAECDALRRLANAPPDVRPPTTTTLRLLMRCLVERHRASALAQAEAIDAPLPKLRRSPSVTEERFEHLRNLFKPPEDELSDELAAAFMATSQQARYFLDSCTRCNLDEGYDLMGALYCNSLTVYDRRATRDAWSAPIEVGVCISPAISMLNHSCEPSATWELDDSGCLRIIALRAIEPGEEVLLSYVDPRLPADERAASLREAFFFGCDCAACEEGGSAWCCALCGCACAPREATCGTRGCSGRREAHAMPLGVRKRLRAR